jgi:hypothetical protein
MTSNGDQGNRGKRVGLRRFLTCIGAGFALSLALAAGSASAKTVYDYVYSGTYIDGSTGGKPFDSGLAGIAYDQHAHRLLVADASTPAVISSYTLSGTPVAFSALGTPWFNIEPTIESAADIAIDQSGGPNDGDFFVRGGNSTINGYKANGTPLSIPFKQLSSENSCGVAVSPDGTEILHAGRGVLQHYDLSGNLIESDFVGPEGIKPGTKIRGNERTRPCRMVFDNNGDLYGIAPEQSFFGSGGTAFKLRPDGLQYYMVNHREDSTGIAVDSADNDVFVLNSEPFSGKAFFELYDEDGRFLGGGWGEEEGSYPGLGGGSQGIAVDSATGDVWIASRHEYAGGITHIEKFVKTNPHVIPNTTATEPEYPDPEGEHMIMTGILNPDGVETTDCRFEFGTEQTGITEGVHTGAELEKLTESVPCQQGNNFTGTADHVVTAEIPTEKGVRYYYKLSAKNSNNQPATSNVEKFVPQGKPIVPGFLAVDRINTDGVRFLTEFDPNGGNASYHFEWGPKGQGFDESTPESETFGFLSNAGLFSGENIYLPGIQHVAKETKGLEPGVTYEYRAVITNEAGSVVTPTQEFTTYVPDSGVDTCANAEVRRQTEGSLLPDCRAYELVSAADQGGYDVESELAAGQNQLDAYPDAKDRLLYSVHFGVIPGIAGSPTNLGLDPYLAVRGNEGWATRYVGLPANGMADEGAFGSPLMGADEGLQTFAFGGPNICNPCFGDGSVNVPLRRPNGTLEEGMHGSLNPPANPVGEVRKPLSADGSHLIFETDQQFEAAANSGSQWVYDRNLASNSTQLVSTTPAGSPISGEVAELDVSSDGSRVLIGKVTGEDAAGNKLYDLYMHVGSNPNSVEVVDSPSGVLYDGMTGDGSKVFFTTTDQLAGDGDNSADLFQADVGDSGAATITWLSTGTGGTGSTDSCNPVDNWNAASGGPNCSVVVPAGGAGVARDDGTVYFMSPEKLDGAANGTQDQPNLYVVKPGEAPHYVGEIDSSIGKPPPAPPAHPVISTNFITGLSNPEGLAVDQETGDIYVAETGNGGRIARFDSSGAPLKFIEGPGAGSNRIPNSGLNQNESQIAVDSSGGVLDGTIYAIHGYGSVAAYSRGGALLGELTGFGEACGVAVNQNTGEVIVGDWSYGGMYRFKPESGGPSVSNANYEVTSIHTQGQNPCHVGVDTAGHAFAVSYSTGPIKKYNISDFAASPPTVAGTEVAGTSRAVSSDPATGDLYNNEGNLIAVYDSAGNKVGTIGSSASLGSTSSGVAVNGSTKETFALNGSNVVKFGYELVPYEPINNSAVINGVHDAAVHHFGDFQVTPDGHYALFSSPVSLTGYQNLGHYEIYRYDAQSDSLACPSCAPTGAVGNSDVKLSPHGLNLADDGRVFFTTRESFTLRDTNEKEDAYEWNNGRIALISSGIGQDDSALVTVTADGKDAFFFTRDVLVPTDKNGNVVKIYDARENGGFPFDPPRGLCKASDECHGPGSEAPPPPNINTTSGPEKARPPVASKQKKCKKPKVLKKGKCVKKAPKKKHKRHSNRRHG